MDSAGNEVIYPFSQGAEDSINKVRYALKIGVDIIFVVGGEETVHSVSIIRISVFPKTLKVLTPY